MFFSLKSILFFFTYGGEPIFQTLSIYYEGIQFILNISNNHYKKKCMAIYKYLSTIKLKNKARSKISHQIYFLTTILLSIFVKFLFFF